MARATTEIVLNAINAYVSFKNFWIGDSGASYHCCNSEGGLFDQITISEMITVRYGNTIKAEKKLCPLI
jgi:hypothetical protein